ncbi:hypothetical protein E2562_014915 [Oryza meyeriana var. granulata]|uniref:Uncharacterized protein n=1 Tax=Oryza meyeriana var. granulata TaxID=110450 RepID=A0A6G1EJ79_9ORYZ|nr:hypothetical protein E2562_014915 [Oryza meyeriana var. granulata]
MPLQSQPGRSRTSRRRTRPRWRGRDDGGPELLLATPHRRARDGAHAAEEEHQQEHGRRGVEAWDAGSWSPRWTDAASMLLGEDDERRQPQLVGFHAGSKIA